MMPDNQITADKDPNFWNRLEARSHIVRPVDALDHVVRVPVIAPTPPLPSSILDPITGKDIQEPNKFVHPLALEKAPGFRPTATKRPKRTDAQGRPIPVFITNRKGQQVQVDAPYHYNILDGEIEYEDFRPVGIRIASDAEGKPLTFATKPGEKGPPKRHVRTKVEDLEDYGEDMAEMNAASILRTRK